MIKKLKKGFKYNYNEILHNPLSNIFLILIYQKI